MRHIDGIVIHCSAGYGDVESIKKFWRENLKWKGNGYHKIIDLQGVINDITPLAEICNGVKGFNVSTVHISYIGGVDKDDYTKAVDTRTPEQKEAILKAINEILTELKKYQDVSKIKIKGHRDFSPDQNGDGVVSKWERIKECPCFDAIPEYKDVVSNFLKK